LPITATNRETLLAHITDEVVIKLFEYRRAANRAQTYGERWLKHSHPATGRVHADYGQLGSRAGRMSCDHPNLQNIPRDPTYRRLFHVPEGSVLVKADYPQIELRLAAVIAQDEIMLKAYLAGEDIHIQTEAGILGLAPGEVTPKARQLAKAVNFGLLYGMGASKLQETAWEDYGVRLSEVEAHHHRTRWFELYPGIKHWHERTGEAVNRRHGIDTRTLWGRRRLGVDRYTEALNTPVQGTGADGLKLALVRLFEHRDEVPHTQLINQWFLGF
jgi:DNA polymerase I